MKSVLKLLKLSFCGPGDVLKEIELGRAVVDEWNRIHGEARGYWVKDQHWKTDSHPTLGDRPQAIINKQMLDESDIVVAIFWRRFGSPTGVADSGTAEEIQRSTQRGRKVMVYFSDLESAKASDLGQTEAVWKFRQQLRENGLCSSFTSRAQFRQDFTRHLGQALNDLCPVPAAAAPTPSVMQTQWGTGNVQAAGDVNVFNRPPVIKTEMARRPDAITSEEARQIQEAINELVQWTAGSTQSEAFSHWWSYFKSTFRIEKYEELKSTEMPAARAWFAEQRAIQKRGLKTKLPGAWKNERIKAIKAAMGEINVKKETYYPEISRRLKIAPPFTSLPDLTKVDLERVYTLVLGEARKARRP